MSETQTTLRDSYQAAYDEHIPETKEVAPVVTETKPAEKSAEERARDEKGRFAEKTEQKSEEKTEAPQRPPRPSSWKKDYEKQWETLDPDLAKYIHQREQEYTKGVSTYKQEWDKAKPLLDAIAPFQQQFAQYGIQPDQWVRTLGAAHQALALGTPQQKLQMFAKLAQDYGVPLQTLLQPQQGQQVDPRIGLQQALQQAIAPIKQEFQQWKTTQEQQQAAQIQREIEAFASKDHPYYEALKETMADLLEKGLAIDLDGAYNIAMRMPQHDDIWTAMQEENRKTEEMKRAEEARQTAISAKKKAPQLKSSSPGSSIATDAKKSIRDAYADAYDANVSGRV